MRFFWTLMVSILPRTKILVPTRRKESFRRSKILYSAIFWEINISKYQSFPEKILNFSQVSKNMFEFFNIQTYSHQSGALYLIDIFDSFNIYQNGYREIGQIALSNCCDIIICGSIRCWNKPQLTCPRYGYDLLKIDLLKNKHLCSE